jgi:hypothetical protein
MPFRKRTWYSGVLVVVVLLLLAGCSGYRVPDFDNFDAQNPMRTSRSYKKEAVRGLKNIMARHERRATLQEPNSGKPSTIVMLYKNEVPVCRLYLGEDWIGFQNCDPRNSDWSQPIYENAMDEEDRRVIRILLRY